jgi:hypothetical protein
VLKQGAGSNVFAGLAGIEPDLDGGLNFHLASNLFSTHEDLI